MTTVNLRSQPIVRINNYDAQGLYTSSRIVDDAVVTAKIADDSIQDSDINANAAITLTKLGTGTLPNTIKIVSANIDANTISLDRLTNPGSGKVILGNASGVATATTVSGDVTISNTGVTSITAGVVVNADINASAAIAFSKLAQGSATSVLGVSGNASASVASISTTTDDRPLRRSGNALDFGQITSGAISDFSSKAMETSADLFTGTHTNVVATESGTGTSRRVTLSLDKVLTSNVTRNVTVSTAAPSGGSSGDIWIQYA